MTSEDQHVIDKLRRADALKPTRSSGPGVPVSLQCTCERVSRSTRNHQRQALEREFREVERNGAALGIEIDWTSLSAVAGTIEALIPLDRWEAARDLLAQRDIRLDIAIDRQVI